MVFTGSEVEGRSKLHSQRLTPINPEFNHDEQQHKTEEKFQRQIPMLSPVYPRIPNPTPILRTCVALSRSMLHRQLLEDRLFEELAHIPERDTPQAHAQEVSRSRNLSERAVSLFYPRPVQYPRRVRTYNQTKGKLSIHHHTR